MPSQPLQPFSPPAVVLSHLPIQTVSANAVLMWLLGIVFFFWAVYTLIITYHWLKYSHDSRQAIPSIITHLVVSLVFFSYALMGALP